MKCDKTNRRKTLDEFALEAEGNEEDEINIEGYEPYDDEASQRVIADLQRSIAGLAWR